MKKTIIVSLVGAVLLQLLTGCATVVALQLNGKMPHVEADDLTVQASYMGVQVGMVRLIGAKYDADGNLVVAEFHEEIGTPTGGLRIDGHNVKLPTKAKVQAAPEVVRP